MEFYIGTANFAKNYGYKKNIISKLKSKHLHFMIWKLDKKMACICDFYWICSYNKLFFCKKFTDSKSSILRYEWE